MTKPYISVIDGKLKTGYEMHRIRIKVRNYSYDLNKAVYVPVSINGKKQPIRNIARVDNAERELLAKEQIDGTDR